MPAKNLNRKNEEGMFVYIYNRGVDKRIIFNDEQDYETFRGFLEEYLSKPSDPESIKKVFTVNGQTYKGTPHMPKNYFGKVELITYSLMPHHFHLIAKQVTQGSLESFIRSLCTRYSIYFNKKYNRTGSLFEGPYKSIHIDDIELLKYLTRHLHKYAHYSSYSEYIGKRNTPWIHPAVVLDTFTNGSRSYKSFVEAYDLTDEENKRIQNMIIFTEPEPLARIDPPHVPIDMPVAVSQTVKTSRYLKPHQRLPELMITAVCFVLLFSLGVKNTTASQSPVILGESITRLPSLSPMPHIYQEPIGTIYPTLTTAPTSTAAPSPTPLISIAQVATVTVKLADASSSADIYRNPDVSSEKISKAQNGDVLEFISFVLDWCEIRMSDGTSGFISTSYIAQ